MADWEVAYDDEFYAEVLKYAEEVQDKLAEMALLLEEFGPQLGRPWADTLKRSKHKNMKELRFKVGKQAWRVAFAFDPQQRGILLAGGNKQGVGEGRFYKALTRTADARFDVHLAPPEIGAARSLKMPVSLKKALADMPPERRARVKANAKRLIAEALTLRDLRKAHEMTQAKVAKTLGITQVSVSNLEKRSDILLSTLSEYVAALGGELQLLVKFPDRPPVALKKFSDLETEA